MVRWRIKATLLQAVLNWLTMAYLDARAVVHFRIEPTTPNVNARQMRLVGSRVLGDRRGTERGMTELWEATQGQRLSSPSMRSQSKRIVSVVLVQNVKSLRTTRRTVEPHTNTTSATVGNEVSERHKHESCGAGPSTASSAREGRRRSFLGRESGSAKDSSQRIKAKLSTSYRTERSKRVIPLTVGRTLKSDKGAVRRQPAARLGPVRGPWDIRTYTQSTPSQRTTTTTTFLFLIARSFEG